MLKEKKKKSAINFVPGSSSCRLTFYTDGSAFQLQKQPLISLLCTLPWQAEPKAIGRAEKKKIFLMIATALGLGKLRGTRSRAFQFESLCICQMSGFENWPSFAETCFSTL